MGSKRAAPKPAATPRGKGGQGNLPETKLARALRERTQALEQQTATAEILRAMSRSPGDAQPVFQAIVDKAHRLCDAAYTILYRYDGEQLSIAGSRHIDAKALRELSSIYPQKPDRARMIEPFAADDEVVIEGNRLAVRIRVSITDGVVTRGEPLLLGDDAALAPRFDRREVVGRRSLGPGDRGDVRATTARKIGRASCRERV